MVWCRTCNLEILDLLGVFFRGGVLAQETSDLPPLVHDPSDRCHGLVVIYEPLLWPLRVRLVSGRSRVRLKVFKTVSNGFPLGAQDYGISATTGQLVSG